MANFNIRGQDKRVFIGGLLVVALVALVAHVMQWPRIVETALDGLATLTGFAGVFFVYKGSTRLGGRVGRGLALIGVGIAYYVATLVPHVLTHVFLSGQVQAQLIPVYLFQHVFTGYAFVISAWGAYLLWKGGGS